MLDGPAGKLYVIFDEEYNPRNREECKCCTVDILWHVFARNVWKGGNQRNVER